MDGRRIAIAGFLFACVGAMPAAASAQPVDDAPAKPAAPASVAPSPAAAAPASKAADAQPGSPAGDASALVARVQAFYDGVTDYRASFRQVVQRRSPRRTFTRSGTVYFKKPGMMRWDYKVPDAVHYVSDGQVLWSYDVAEGVAFRMPIADSDLFHALGFLTGTARLADVFDATGGAPAADGLASVRLVPKGGESGYRAVTLFADPATGEVRQTEVEDPVGNVSHLWFDQPSYRALPAKGFAFKVPAGVRVEEIGSE